MPSTKPRLFINGYGVADVAYEKEVDIPVTWSEKLLGTADLRSAKRIGDIVFVTCQSNVSGTRIAANEAIVSGLPLANATVVNFVSGYDDVNPIGLGMFYLYDGTVYCRRQVDYLYLNLIYLAAD